jgi:hypothetical protein
MALVAPEQNNRAERDTVEIEQKQDDSEHPAEQQVCVLRRLLDETSPSAQQSQNETVRRACCQEKQMSFCTS